MISKGEYQESTEQRQITSGRLRKGGKGEVDHRSVVGNQEGGKKYQFSFKEWKRAKSQKKKPLHWE